mmetsp:Transcript_98632/g.263741  ORF Transcript_98632/g.263741 Transcript_98632/m.263741 type:complete len:449 (-) Transcript_98632:361-1707(-)
MKADKIIPRIGSQSTVADEDSLLSASATASLDSSLHPECDSDGDDSDAASLLARRSGATLGHLQMNENVTPLAIPPTPSPRYYGQWNAPLPPPRMWPAGGFLMPPVPVSSCRNNQLPPTCPTIDVGKSGACKRGRKKSKSCEQVDAVCPLRNRELRDKIARGIVDVHVEESLLASVGRLARDKVGKDVISDLASRSGVDAVRVASALRTSTVALATHVHGCRVLQAVIASGSEAAANTLLAEMHTKLKEMIFDTHGNHVMQRITESCSTEDLAFVAEEVADDVVALSKHPFGCRVLQRIIQRGDDVTTSAICDTVLANVHELVTHQFANYVVQHVLQYGPQRHRSMLVAEVCRKMAQWCKQKFASNVVENALRSFPGSEDLLIDTVLRQSGLLGIMATSQFGNYVVQAMLDLNPRPDLIAALRALPNLRGYGKHIQGALNRICRDAEA